MDPRQGRRLAACALLLCCFLLTTWLDATLTADTFELNTRAKRSTADGGGVKNRGLKELVRSGRVRSDVEYQRLREKIMKQYEGEESGDLEGVKGLLVESKEDATYRGENKGSREGEGVRGPLGYAKEGVSEDELDRDLEEMEAVYSKIIEDKAREIKRKVYTCLPKFICEVHSQSSEKITTELEREWLKMYNPTYLSDQVHELQMAAHMGQLFRGYQPSPCHQLYTNCPITMTQLKKFLTTFSVKKIRV